MQKMNLQQLAFVVEGEIIAENPSVAFDTVSTDTRSINKGSLFIALKGDNFDADLFVDQAQQNGAVAALVSKKTQNTLPVVKVADVHLALTKLAAAEREKTTVPVVAITGSNGKTTVKEMLASILQQSRSVLATAGNFNNHIGVPLTLLRLRADHELVVLEMGASKPGDIAELCDIAKPNVCVLNNVAAAHIAGFGDLNGVAKTKAEIISGLAKGGVAILNRDEPWFDEWRDLVAEKKTISFGLNNNADLHLVPGSLVSTLEKGGFNTHFSLSYQAEKMAISMSLMGLHNVQNALAAAAAAFALGASKADIINGLAALKPVKSRMQPQQGVLGSIVIDDSYNANPRSLEAALTALSALTQPVWLVLGDFAELGENETAIHQEMGRLIARSNIQRFFAVGDKMLLAVNSFQENAKNSERPAEFFKEKQSLVTALKDELLKTNTETVVLIKGSRSQRMEEVVEHIVEKESC